MPSLHTPLLACSVARNLGDNYSRLALHVQRLSSGLRVNTAADDAAGLGIREMMRAEVAALHQGARNANDAISLIQTADGALAVIDEKLIRMKELAEQAATGTYDSTQRLMIDNEFQAMGAEIDRIARSTEFNGIKLLDGSREGEHDGSGMEATGALKIHFGSGNDSAEDYYYLNIGDCTLAGLGLALPSKLFKIPEKDLGVEEPGGQIIFSDGTSVAVNDLQAYVKKYDGYIMWQNSNPLNLGPFVYTPPGRPTDVQSVLWTNDWCNNIGYWSGFGFCHIIPKGTKNFMFNIDHGNFSDVDIQLFTLDGKHLVGTPLDDVSNSTENIFGTWPYWVTGRPSETSDIASYSPWLGFSEEDYDGSVLNSGPAQYETGVVTNDSLNWSTYNGMRIGYTGDGNLSNDGITQEGRGYEVLVIDGEVTEDLVIWTSGDMNQYYKMYWDNGPDRPEWADKTVEYLKTVGVNVGTWGDMDVTVATQEQAQNVLSRIDNAIAIKDRVRAHLGAMQNRLENTVTNLTIQAENLQAAESRISDADVALEMTQFVREQILTQAATAMLTQANALPGMLAGLLRM